MLHKFLKCSQISAFSMACPMGKQQIRITAGTKIRYRQMFRKDPCIPQHNLITFPQIQLIFSTALFDQDLTLMTGKLFCKDRCHIFTYFITVLTDGRSNGGKNFSGVTMKFPAHHLDGMLPHSSDRSSPPGMRKSDRMVYGIYKIKRYTVSVKSCQNQSRFIRHQPVHIRIRPLLSHTIAPAASIHPPDIRRMGLIRTDDI